jgi:hypothetical protein
MERPMSQAFEASRSLTALAWVLSASRWQPLVPFPFASPCRFSRSIQEPGRASRRLHAGCRSGSLRQSDQTVRGRACWRVRGQTGAACGIRRDPDQPSICLVMERGIDRHEIVGTRELHRVPAVTDKCNVGVAGGAREVDRFFLHADLVEIQTDDRLKTKPLQRLGHVRRIILRILKCGGIFVCRIAYDERDALLGMRSHAAEMTNAKITASNRMAPAPWIAQVCHWQIAVATAYDVATEIFLCRLRGREQH